MPEKSLSIIGAGIAGLSAGCYAQMNGYRSRIYEMHTLPGGLCTAWKRKGYTIDGCIEWLVGSSPRSSFYRLWEEVGLIQGREIIYLDEMMQTDGPDGRAFTLYTDLDRLEQHMIELAPEDRVVTEEVIGGARHFLGFDMTADEPPMEIMGVLEKAKMMGRMLPHMPTLQKWSKVSLGELASRFKSPILREAFDAMWHPKMSSLFILMTLAWLHDRVAGYPIGGSLPLARAVEQRYLNLGGQIHYSSRVARVLVENSRAVGIRLDNGQEERADVVISAADGHATIFDMLEGKHVDDTVRHYYDKFTPFPPLVFVGLGVNRTFEDEPRRISGLRLPLDPPLRLGDETITGMGVRINNYDPTLAPAGKTPITASFHTHYPYWKSLHADTEGYEARKAEIADAIVGVLDRRYPGLASQVEMVDVSTPITFEEFTGNWQASYEGWLPTPDNALSEMRKTLPGLDSFYMVGQWVSPGGGLPSGVKTARDTLQVLCKRDGIRFQTNTG